MNLQSEIVQDIVKILDNKKARNIQVLDLRGLTTITDYFVIATGNSTTQVQALSDNVEEELIKKDIKCSGREGYNTAAWILLDYEDVLVHIFQNETREFYKLEHVWQDAKVIDISDLVTN